MTDDQAGAASAGSSCSHGACGLSLGDVTSGHTLCSPFKTLESNKQHVTSSALATLQSGKQFRPGVELCAACYMYQLCTAAHQHHTVL